LNAIIAVTLNACVAYLFGMLNKKVYKVSQEKRKGVWWWLKFLLTAFLSLFYFMSLPAVFLKNSGFSGSSGMFFSLVSLPIIIIWYRKILRKWSANNEE